MSTQQGARQVASRRIPFRQSDANAHDLSPTSSLAQRWIQVSQQLEQHPSSAQNYPKRSAVAYRRYKLLRGPLLKRHLPPFFSMIRRQPREEGQDLLAAPG